MTKCDEGGGDIFQGIGPVPDSSFPGMWLTMREDAPC